MVLGAWHRNSRHKSHRRSPPKNSPQAIRREILDNLFCTQAKFFEVATRNDYYMALAQTIRHRAIHRWFHTAHTYYTRASRTVIYLSAEYLLGPQLGNNLINLGIYEPARRAVATLGLSLDDLLQWEEEPGLGNGGLGRLAACFMDSLATLAIPAIGYGIRYEYGIFDQEIRNGWQVEVTDKWLRMGNPWEIPRPEIAYPIRFGGHTEHYRDPSGRFCVRWIPEQTIRGTAFDTPMLGYAVNNTNLLRLWKSEAYQSFDFKAFNMGDYYGAVEEKIVSENLTKVLYPNDESMAGKALRLQQQYFFVACSLQDMIRIYRQRGKSLAQLHRKFAVQLNDTHPAIGVLELMRLLVDEYRMDWTKAWEITTRTFAYTNHTLLPEAMEKWPLPLFARLLPRHLELLYEINMRFLDQVRLQSPGDDGRVARMSLIDETGEKYVRMANLACAGSHAINGVAKLHTDLLQQTVLRDFYALWPEKFSNKTNGITPRRFLVLSNPGLTRLLTATLGAHWIKDLAALRRLEKFTDDPGFREEWRRIKGANKRALAAVIHATTRIAVDPASLFDIQVKRIHEYKRQHLNVLHILTLYHRLTTKPGLAFTPRTFIFGGKAAPGYAVAKLIIKLIHSIAEVINNDPDVKDRLKVVFLPDFNVKNAQHIYPAADLSEQISTAGMEASGTGNMKFGLNGALTIGTLDGANIEIREEVGAENFFFFGLTAAEVAQRRIAGYQPRALYDANPELRAVLDALGDGTFARGDRSLFQPLLRSLLERDDHFLLADYASYVACQDVVGQTYHNPVAWTRMSILNVARMGKFSSDRAVREYCRDIWKVKPVPVSLRD